MNQFPDIHAGSTSVLVSGATGGIGHEVVRRLVAAGVEVRAMHRREDQADELVAEGARPVRADFTDRASLRAALEGVDRFFLLTPPVPAQFEFERTAIDSAAGVGVRQVVRVSAGDSNLRTAVPWARAHARADHHLAATRLNWTVLRPSAFTQNLAEQAVTVRRGLLPHTAGRGEVSWIDTRDVAAVAVRVLTGALDAHPRATYFLTGPEPLSFAGVAGRMSRVLGRTVRAVQLPRPAYVRLLRLGGQDAFTARGLGVQFGDVVRRDLDIDTTAEVERLTGRPARTVDDWIEDNRAVLTRH